MSLPDPDVVSPLSRQMAAMVGASLPALAVPLACLAGTPLPPEANALMVALAPLPLAAGGGAWLRAATASASRRVRRARHRVESRLMPVAALIGTAGAALSATGTLRLHAAASSDAVVAGWSLGTALWGMGAAFAAGRTLYVAVHGWRRRERRLAVYPAAARLRPAIRATADLDGASRPS